MEAEQSDLGRTVGQLTVPRLEERYVDGVSLGFELAGHLISAPSHHAMTCILLRMIDQFPGVIETACYEVFSKTGSDNRFNNGEELLFRRFPLTLDDNYEDKNTDLLVALLFQDERDIILSQHQGRNCILLRINQVLPRRVVFIEGILDEQYFAILKGLYAVYARQTHLLDAKERDSLTHLLNRQSLDQTLSQVQHYYQENRHTGDSASWLAVLDIDRFKQINDTYGHIFGDEILIHFANILQQHMRFSDFLFRFGGEEFIVILNQINAKGAELAFERLRKAVEQFEFPSGSVTVSIGYSVINPDKAQEIVLEEADKAVYRAKNTGRNCVVNYADIAAELAPCVCDGDVELF